MARSDNHASESDTAELWMGGNTQAKYPVGTAILRDTVSQALHGQSLLQMRHLRTLRRLESCAPHKEIWTRMNDLAV